MSLNLSPRTVGFASSALSAVCFGTISFFAKTAYAGGVTVLGVLTVRFLLATIALAALDFALARHRPAARAPALTKRERRVAFFMGLIGYCGQASLVFVAISRIDSGLAILLLYLFPLLLFVFDSLRARRFPDARHVVILICAFAGCALALVPVGAPGSAGGVNLAAGRLDPVGVACGLASAVWYAAYLLVGQKYLKGASAQKSALTICFGAACAFVAASVVAGFVSSVSVSPGPSFAHPDFDGASVLALAGLALVSTAVPIALLLSSLRVIPAAQAGLISMLEPVTTLVVGALVFHETASVSQRGGVALILAALVGLRLLDARGHSAVRSDFETPACEDRGSGSGKVCATPDA